MNEGHDSLRTKGASYSRRTQHRLRRYQCTRARPHLRPKVGTVPQRWRFLLRTDGGTLADRCLVGAEVACLG